MFFTIFLLAFCSLISEIVTNSPKIKDSNLNARYSYPIENRLDSTRLPFPNPDAEDEEPFSPDSFLPWNEPIQTKHAINSHKPKKHRSWKHFSPHRNRKGAMSHLNRKHHLALVTNQGRFTNNFQTNESPSSSGLDHEQTLNNKDQYDLNRRLLINEDVNPRINKNRRYHLRPWDESSTFYAEQTSPKINRGELRHGRSDQTRSQEKLLRKIQKDKYIQFRNFDYENDEDSPIDVELNDEETNEEDPNTEFLSTDHMPMDASSSISTILDSSFESDLERILDVLNDVLEIKDNNQSLMIEEAELKNILRPHNPTKSPVTDSTAQKDLTSSIPSLFKNPPISNSKNESDSVGDSKELNDETRESFMQEKIENKVSNVTVIVKSKNHTNYSFRKVGPKMKTMKNQKNINSDATKNYTTSPLQKTVEVEEVSTQFSVGVSKLQFSNQNNRPTTLGKNKGNSFTTPNIDENLKDRNVYLNSMKLSDTFTADSSKLDDTSTITTKTNDKIRSELLDLILNDIEKNGYPDSEYSTDVLTNEDASKEQSEGTKPSTNLGYDTRRSDVIKEFLENTSSISKLREDEKGVNSNGSSAKTFPFLSSIKELLGNNSYEVTTHGNALSESKNETRTSNLTNQTHPLSLGGTIDDVLSTIENYPDGVGRTKQKSKKVSTDKETLLMASFIGMLKKNLDELEEKDKGIDENTVVNFYERKLQLAAVFTLIIGLVVLGILLMTLAFRLRLIRAVEDKSGRKITRKTLVEQKVVSEIKIENVPEKITETEFYNRYKLKLPELKAFIDQLNENLSSENLPEKETIAELQRRLLGVTSSVISEPSRGET